MRNVLKQAELGRKKITKGYDLSWKEIEQFYELAKNPRPNRDSIYEVMDIAFHMGYAVGLRAAQKK